MATGIANLVSYDLKGVKESFANWISNISPSDTPFTSMTGKENVNNKYFQWQEDTLHGVDGNNAVAEGSDAAAPAGGLSTTTVRQNVTQILRKVVQVSDTTNAFANYGRGNELQYQMEKASKELKRDIEWALLNNGIANSAQDVTEPGIAAGTGNDSGIGGGTNTGSLGTAPDLGDAQVRRTKGFSELVATKGSHSPDDVLAIVHTDVKTAGTLKEDDIFELTRGLYLAGAKATHIMYHPKFAAFFSSLMEKVSPDGNRMRMFNGEVDQKVNKYVSEMIDPLGQRFVLLPNRFMPDDRIYFMNPSDWTQMILRQPGAQLLAKTGSYDKYMIEIELGLRLRNQYAAGILVVGSASVPHNFTGTGVTQNGTTVTISAKTGDADIDVDVSGLTSALVAGTAPATAVADFSDFDTDGFTVTIKGKGTASGTVIADGVTYTVNVNVTDPAPVVVKPTGVSITGPGVAAGKVTLASTTGTVQLAAAVTPAGATDKTVTWSSATPATATVSAAGLVKGVTAGKVVITATAKGDNTVKATVEVTVPPAAPPALTGFTLAGTATGATFDANAKTLVFAKLADSSADGIVLTPTAVPSGATLGALSVTNADDTKAAATVAPAGKFTVKPVAVDTTGTTVTLKVAGAPDYVLTVTTLA